MPRIKKDETLNNFIKELREYHEKGFVMRTPVWQESADDGNNINYVYCEVGMERENNQ